MSKVIGWFGMLLVIWGFVWGIFIEEFLLLCAVGFGIGWIGCLLEDRGY